MPIRTRSVTADNRARSINASGDGLGDATWPPTQSESIGMASSAATRRMSSFATKPILISLMPRQSGSAV